MKNCIDCGTPTTGSTGAAGIYWTNLCQSCKDKADKALERKCMMIERAVRAGYLAGGPTTSWGAPVSASGVELDHDDHYHDRRDRRTEDFDGGQE